MHCKLLAVDSEIVIKVILIITILFNKQIEIKKVLYLVRNSNRNVLEEWCKFIRVYFYGILVNGLGG